MPESQDQLKPTEKNAPKIALVHDFLVASGGAERVLKVLAEMYPEAPVYTLLYDHETMAGFLAGRDIRTSFLQKFPRRLRKRYRWLLPLFPAAIEALDLRDFDVVISSSGAWSKGIVTRLRTRHLAYIHSPMRFVWDYNERYLREQGQWKWGLLTRALLSWLRIWDAQAADRPDMLVVNSIYTQKRVKKYYRREAEVVYPPITINAVDVRHEFSPINLSERRHPRVEALSETLHFSKEIEEQGYFLVVSRLTKNKKADIAVEAFNKLGLPLIVVGRGAELEALRQAAGPLVRVIGWRSDAEVARLYAQARAVVFPSEDDFGLVVAEAMAYGTPVIAYTQGGAREIVQEGVTGEVFLDQTAEVLADGVRRFLEREGQYDTEIMQKTASRFTREAFETRIRALVDELANDDV